VEKEGRLSTCKTTSELNQRVLLMGGLTEVGGRIKGQQLCTVLFICVYINVPIHNKALLYDFGYW